MSAYEGELRKTAQDPDNPVRIGIIVAEIAGVHEYGKPPVLAQFKDPHGLPAIRPEALDVRMKLHPA